MNERYAIEWYLSNRWLIHTDNYVTKQSAFDRLASIQMTYADTEFRVVKIYEVHEIVYDD